LVKLGGTRQQAIDLVSSNLLVSGDASKPADGALQGVYDVRVPADESMVIWWNDLEKDQRYKGWRPDLSAVSILFFILFFGTRNG
jgi:UDP-glucose:glycoprotein glucosyltransferase